jgi:hypothetical protein
MSNLMALGLSSGKCIARCCIEDDAGLIDSFMALRIGRHQTRGAGQSTDLAQLK